MDLKIIDSNILPNKSISKIFHISDIHIPNETTKHEEFRLVFTNLYDIIKSRKTANSLIVVTGDIINKSNRISPECIDLVKNFFFNLSKICYTIIIPGNHDDNIRGNDLKIDSLSSIIHDLNYKNLVYFRNTGVYNVGNNITFALTSVFDETLIKSTDYKTDRLKIALYHGMVEAIDNNRNHLAKGDYKFTSLDFDGFDYVLLGDIHNFNYLNKEKTIAYSGSLIQLSHGEDINTHGGLLEWDLDSGVSNFINIPNNYGYVTINIKDNVVNIPDYYPHKSRIRVRYEGEYKSISEIEKLLKTQLNCNIEELKVQYLNENENNNIENHINNQNDFLDYLTNICKLDINRRDRIYDIHQKAIKLENRDNELVKSLWKIMKIEFENILCFSSKQSINFNTICLKDNLCGILGKNAQGKSSLVLIILYSLFGSIPGLNLDELKNKNNSSKHLKTKITFSLSDDNYVIERTLKTVKLFKDGINISEASKRETENVITNLIGDLNVIKNTNVSLQEQHNNLINSNNSDKFKIVKKILGIDIYDDINNKIKSKVKELEEEYKDLKKDTEKKELLKNTKPNLLEELEKLELNRKEYEIKKENNDKKSIFIQLDKTFNKLNKSKSDLEDNIKTINKTLKKYDEKLLGKEKENKLIQLENNLTKVSELQKKYIPNLENINIQDLNTKKKELKEKLGRDLENKVEIEKQLEELNNINFPNNLKELYDKSITDKNLYLQYGKDIKKLNTTIKKKKKLIDDHKCKYNLKCKECLYNKKQNGLQYNEEEYNELLIEKEKFNNELEKLGKNMKNCNDIIDQYNNFLEIEPNKNKCNLELNELTLNIEKLEFEIDKVDSKLQNEININANEIIDNEIEDINLENKKIKKEIKNIEKKLGENEKCKNQLDKYNCKLEETEHNLHTTLRELEELNYIKDDYDDKGLINIYKDIGKIESKLDEIKEIEGTLDSELQNLKELSEELNDYKLYSDITNWKGYPIYLINKKINVLENEINKILGNIVPFSCKIVLSNEGQKKEDLTFYKKDNILIPVKNCSGFEKFIFSIAIRIGLIKISNYMTPNFIIIDEGFGCMDDKNLKNIGDVFSNIKNVFDLILIITHKEELKDELKNIIKLDNYKISY